MPSLFSGRGAEGWHAPAGRRTCEPRPLVQDGQIRPAVPVGAIKTSDPADRSFRRTTRAASAESEVRPGPRLPTLRPHHLKTGEAGPEALPTLSLPGRKHYPHSPCRLCAGHPLSAGIVGGVQIHQFWASSALVINRPMARLLLAALRSLAVPSPVPLARDGSNRVSRHQRTLSDRLFW